VPGVSWEGFVIETLLTVIPQREQASYYRSAGGAEMDLVYLKGVEATLAEWNSQADEEAVGDRHLGPTIGMATGLADRQPHGGGRVAGRPRGMTIDTL
jgi:hypothetical protein